MADSSGMQRVAAVIGVGAARGLGAAVSRRVAREGFNVFIGGRTEKRLSEHVAKAEGRGETMTPIMVDATSPESVSTFFDQVEAADGTLELVIYNAGINQPIPFMELAPETVEEFWRVCCFGGFLTLQEAAKRLLPRGKGTIICTGATGAMRGRAGFGHFAAAKSGLRMFTQSVARELGPKGIHVAHVVIDGGIDGDRLRTRRPEMVKAKGEQGLLNIDGIADLYWHIHCQEPTTWTLEADLRPYKESF